MGQDNQGFLNPGMPGQIVPKRRKKNYHHTLHKMPEERRSHMRDVLRNVTERIM